MQAYGVGATKRIAYRGARQCGSTHAPGANIAAAIRSQKKAERLAAKKDIEQWLEVLVPEPLPEDREFDYERYYDYLHCDWDVEPVFSSSNAYDAYDDDLHAYDEFEYDYRNCHNPPL